MIIIPMKIDRDDLLVYLRQKYYWLPGGQIKEMISKHKAFEFTLNVTPTSPSTLDLTAKGKRS